MVTTVTMVANMITMMALVLVGVVTVTAEVDGLLLLVAAAAAITACSSFLFLLTAAVAAAPLR